MRKGGRGRSESLFKITELLRRLFESNFCSDTGMKNLLVRE